MLLLGIDLGTSSVKVSVVDASTQQTLASAQFPDTEAPIIAPVPGWAEQDPEQWWLYVKQAILKAHATGHYSPADIGAIGIAYQMHGLVAVDETDTPVRNSIIWCDSRAVPYGEKAFHAIGEDVSLRCMLNSPGNFTAAKLAWVKENEPEIYDRIKKIMLPGDYIALRLTGECTTTVSALSEGIFWNFETNGLSEEVMDFFGFDKSFIPAIQPLFSPHGFISGKIADELQLKTGIPVTYKAGDQPNNALSLNVMRPGEVAATAGTSGVIYGVADRLVFDQQSRINSFAHVNHHAQDPRIGVLLCINGCGILNKSIRQLTGNTLGYASINAEAGGIEAGSNGLKILPFGNGAERMLGNKTTGAQIKGWDFNIHHTAHFYRAAQEGVAFAFRYGFDIMRENGMTPTLIRAGKANMFLSDVFAQSLVDVLNVPVELYNADGSVGAALGAGIGAGLFDEHDLGKGLSCLKIIEPQNHLHYNELYLDWHTWLLDELI
ncbi:MAG: FGGY family carbohydrate kinase [Chitinophagaceae bacterium]|jgi:xylulokinase|nr:FGGY family carbohydrate kinase [Chitinophagaceae bacterium]